MRRSLLLVGVALVAASGGMRVAAAPPTPVVVELFTSEGCSDCPPADTLLDNLIGTQPIAGAEIIGLGEHVDYWDRQGWRDRFSLALWTSRQQVYQSRFGIESIYTPQMIVDGRAELVGSDANAARKAIERTLTAPHGRIAASIDGGRVTAAASDLPRLGRGDRADIVVAVTESGLSTDVRSGENHGKLLHHAPVVRSMTTIGQIAGDGATAGSASAEIPIAADWRRDRLTVVAFVQETRGRTILASAALPLQNLRP